MSDQYAKECEARRKIVANTLAVVMTATQGPNGAFKKALDDYISGRLSFEELQERTNRMEYLEN